MLARLLSTRHKSGFGQTAKDLVKWTSIICAFSCLFALAKFGVEDELLERAHPTPPTWSWISRWKLRSAQGAEDAEPGLRPNWAAVGANYKALIGRLEDVNGDGHRVRSQLGEDGHIFVEGVGKTGLDISAMPEPWRQGYHQALMGAARAAEHLEFFVRDKTRGFVFPRSVVLGPSNPRPRPVARTSRPPPIEADCEPAFEPPEAFYMKILTTHGFTSRQRLDAALAYADWLHYRGLNESAREVHAWALDIATDKLPGTSEPLIDRSTAILSSEASGLSPNLILAASSIAKHHAQTGNLDAALPIFLSILRAQQSFPPSREPILQNPRLGILDNMKALVLPPPYPQVPSSGDEPATASPANTCAIAGTMLIIGEIIFASDTSNPLDSATPSSNQGFGLSWTRQATDLAESMLREIAPAPAEANSLGSPPHLVTYNTARAEELLDAHAKKHCAECLSAGLRNWQAMLRRFQEAEIKEATKAACQVSQGSNYQDSSGSRFWRGSDKKQEASEGVQSDEQVIAESRDKFNGVWMQEGRKLQQRIVAARRLLRQQDLDRFM